ncbi:LSU ribosomal protein L29p (L35e) [Candidatus Syntrophocurvum alkaliphilum]|uniref:Large ribosomal subunit protein uL29 n=1 Tax=Candidatus Syntrophocurvum alkaliphilum TaxID=2293317 RepID=A0A6I6DFG5_9FIRM|nr:50S ribosomal protein L29 [Candidatus Syntrophocurvum alkaliphilum]QGU00786.1 LSU ribosomal protein L29p (L35e) [Candidatus Syntrophocurvum alkaliphilum]
MKAKQARELTDDELRKKVSDYKEELFNLRFQLATGQLDNPMRIRDVKKSIARCKTILRQRELARQQ